METEEPNEKVRPIRQEAPPLVFTVSIKRENGLVASANNIGVNGDSIRDIAMVLEAFDQLSRELQASLVDLRVAQRLEEIDLKAAPHPGAAAESCS